MTAHSSIPVSDPETAVKTVDSIPWFQPCFENDEADAVSAVIASGYVNDGPVCRAFEAAMADRLGADYAVVTTSGTAAISLALLALGFGPGDEAIVPDLTFIATANAVRMVGGEVRFADVTPGRFTIDPDAVEAAITPRTRAVVSVDVNGRACDYARLEKICEARDLLLVCDTAEGLGSALGGRALGTYGHAGAFSFSPNKFITTGQGGLVVTRDGAAATRLRELKDQGRAVQGTGGDDLHPRLGFNFKMTDMQAAVGLRQLEALDRRLDRARQRDRWYRQRLGDLASLRFPETSDDEEVCLWTDILAERADAIVSALREARIGHRRFWHPLHTQGTYGGAVDAAAAYPVSIRSSAEGLWLPSYFDLSEAEVDRTCDVIRQALTR